MGFDDFLGDGHAETSSLVLRGEERVEDAADLVRRDAAAVVADAHGRRSAVAARAVLDEQVDPPPFGYAVERIDGIVQNVGEYLSQLLAIREDGRSDDVVPPDADLGSVELG